MDDQQHDEANRPKTAAIFGASGGIGSALASKLADRGYRVYAGSRDGSVSENSGIIPFKFDLTDEGSIAAVANMLRGGEPDLVVVATGVLTLADGRGPERSYKKLDGVTMEEVIRLNTVGPAIIAKHILPLLPRNKRSVFAALSARVGSISDNALGGWHSYRASKAALNMLLKNFAIELARTHKHSLVVGLHPGTVDTALSQPFQSNLPGGQLTQAPDAAAHLLNVIANLTSDHSGKVFDWKGDEIPA